jgi:outer membrane receptor protein involved in Fe transport
MWGVSDHDAGARAWSGCVRRRQGTCGVRRAAPLLAVLAALIASIPPAQGQDSAAPAADPSLGTVLGVIVDADSARPLADARLEVIGRNETTRTDNQGFYKLTLPAGTYELRVYAPNHQGMRLRNLTVFAGKTTRVDANLKDVGEAGLQVVEVVGEAAASTEQTQLLLRQKSAGVSDNVSAETIGKTTDSNVASAVVRAPAITLTDDKFVVVRGLVERYSVAQLNGSRLPSTDPNKRIPPFDIFPADFIAALNIIKTYTPDLPGDFAGALIDIKLAEPPPKLTYSLGASMSFNTETTFRSVNTYTSPCATRDWFTLGNQCRDLPGLFGNDTPRNPTTPQMRAYVGALPNDWNINWVTAPPNFSVRGAVGDSIGPFGFNLAAVYGSKWKIKRDATNNAIVNVTVQPMMPPTFAEDVFTYNISDREVQLGALLTTQYKIDADNVVSGRALVNRLADDQTQDGRGTLESRGMNLQFPSSTVYTLNQLGFGQLEGHHHFSIVDGDWRAAWAPSLQDQPDAKYLIYELTGDPPAVLSNRQPSLLRTFGTLNEFLQDYDADAAVPFRTGLPFTDVWSGLEARFKTGLAWQTRDRTFDFRRFSSTTVGETFSGPPESILIPPNYSRTGPLTFSENTTDNDSFEGSEQVSGGYGMIDLPLVADRLSFIGGARGEYSYIVAKGAVVGQGPVKTILNNVNPLPSAILKYTPTDDMNVRAAFSQTVSRPDFRELTPTRFPALPGQRVLLGNPFLIQTDITNYDLRWEWFFTPLELVSAGFFYKDLTNPIELAALVETSQYIDFYVNAKTANLWGFEFEVRKNFDFLVPRAAEVSWLRRVAPALADVQVEVNASVIQSEVSGIISPDPKKPVTVTNPTRPLLGQPPFTINASLQYADSDYGTFRLLYRTIGRTIVAAGTDVQPETPSGALPDIYRERRDQLDFIWLKDFEAFDVPLTGKFGVENITNDNYVQTQGDLTVEKYRTGATFVLGVSYKF